jgi:hypothetical protein
MEAEPPKWHFQAKPGNETLVGFFYCKSDERELQRVSLG